MKAVCRKNRSRVYVIKVRDQRGHVKDPDCGSELSSGNSDNEEKQQI